MDDVRLAIERGYLVFKIHEFYKYELTQYVPNNGEVGHVVQYINNLNLKAEPSGYPSSFQGPEDADSYVKYFRESGRIELDKTTIQIRTAKCRLAKFCFKSWDKSEIIVKPQEPFRFLSTLVSR